MGEGGACEAEAVEALEAVSENARTISKGLQRQTLAAYAQAARPRTPTGVQPPRPSDLNEERRMEEARMQSTIRAQAPMAEDRSRSKMRQNLERSFKKGQLPYSSSTRCFRCGADHPDSVCRDLHEFLQKQKIPKYKRLPDVEVSFKVRSISDLDSKTGTFLADFLLELHWVDPGLERDTHYTEDYQSQTLQLFPAFESHIFNPEVVLENAVETLVPLPSSESQPVIQAEAIHGLWMRRRVHFKGLLACANISYANFPLDTHAISISVTLKKWQGLTPKVVSPVPEVKEVRNRSKDQKQEDWPGHAVAQDSIHLGDLNFVAWGVWSQHGPETEGQREEDQYELIMVMRRSFRRHFFTFFILSMAVLSGATSLFCPLSIDMLAGRLSINVTVLLSMVAFSVQRPSAIEAVPYNTIHDIFVQVCTLLTATLSLCNLATQLTCFEMTEGCDECVREDLPELCALGSCGSKVLDCYFFYTLLLLLVFIDLGLLLWARHLRSAELRHFRALCKDLGAEQGATRSGWCSWACCRCRHPCRRRVQPLDVRAKVAQSLPRRKTKQLASSGAHRAYGGVPCFFLREKGGRFLPVPGGLCEMMQMEWKDALERVQVKDRASAVPLRRCISRFSRASVGTNAFSRRLAHPTVLEGVETHYMDLGGGEVGYYRYCHLPDAPPLEQVTCMAAEKLEWPGLTEVLEQEDPVRIAELCQSLVSYLVHETGKKNGTAAFARHLEERALEEGKEEASLLVGITGEVAAQLLEGRRPREPLELFLEDLEDELCTASGKQWEIYYFLLRKEDEAFYERIAIGWLLENTDLKLTDTFAKDPKLEGYMRRQTTSWALLSGRKNIGQMEQDEFIERFMPLSRQPTFERRAWEALEWFRVMDEDGSGTITVSEMLNCMLVSEDLLQAVIRHRLFVGTLAGGPRSVQLTVAEPDPEKEGEVQMHYAKVGTRSPVVWGLFNAQEEVTREVLLRWETFLVSVIENVPLSAELEDLDKAQHMSQLLRENQSQEWPSGLRGIFVGISSMFYAARDAGITARLIQKKDCLSAFTTALEAELRDPKGAREDPKKLQLHHQKVANLAMAHSFISRLLHDDAWLYFRRSWQMGQSSFIATWSLGVFLNGKRKDGNQATGKTAGAFTRVRSRLDEAVDAVEHMEEQNKQHNWARRLSAALRFSARVRRSHSSSTMD